jgi:NAD(P)-dependent dehydrogenase (short-subunit alcohol dehydrogenase family)
VRKCASTIKSKYSSINILVNNGGISLNTSERKFTKDGFEAHMGTNHLGHFLLTLLLLENIKRAPNSRIITVSSTGAVMSKLKMDNLMLDNCSLGVGNSLPYMNSKMANILFTRELAKRLEGSGVNTYAVCPGFVKTRIFRDFTPTFKFIYNTASIIYGLPVHKVNILSFNLKSLKMFVFLGCRYNPVLCIGKRTFQL